MEASPDRFADEITEKGWSALDGVPFADLPVYSERATAWLRSRGVLGGNDLRLKLEAEFRAICPSCSRWLSFSDLFGLRMSGVTLTSYGPVSRMRDGLCPNADCTETQGMVIWAGDPTTMKNIDSSMQYLRSKCNAPDDALQRYYRRDVVAFLADVIALNVSARRSCSTGRILSGDTGEEPVAVHLTIVHGNPDPEWTRVNIFPDGYVSFFNTLLSHPQCDHNEVALMHWTYVFDETSQLLRLMFLDRKRDKALPGMLRCPFDLMTEEERKQFDRYQMD